MTDEDLRRYLHGEISRYTVPVENESLPCVVCGKRTTSRHLNQPMHNACFEREYTRDQVTGDTIKRSESVKTEEGYTVLANGNTKRMCSACQKHFYSIDPLKYCQAKRGDKNVVCRTCANKMGRAYGFGMTAGYCREEDIVMDDCGNPLYRGFAEDCKRKCEFCGKIHINAGTISLMVGGRTIRGFACKECVSKRKRCRGCGVIHDGQYEDGFISKFVKIPGNKSASADPKMYCAACAKPQFPLIYDGIKEVVGLGRGIGVEIECEADERAQEMIALWVSDKRHLAFGEVDHSLRGKFQCEFKSPILHESNYREWVNEICGFMHGHSRVYNRCGLHIHIGTGDLSWWEIMNVARWCKKHEREIFSVVSPSRRIGIEGNNAGLPLKLPTIPEFRDRREFLDFLYGKDRNVKDIGQRIRKSKRANDRDVHYNGAIHRYWWLNLHGHFFKRAIEIRLHQGTTNAEKITNWIDMWLKIVEAAKDHRRYGDSLFKILPKHLELYYLARKEALSTVAAQPLGD